MWKCYLWRKKALTHLCKEFVIENLWRSFNILKDKLCFFWRDPFPFFNSGLISYCCCNVLFERLSQPHHRPWPQSRRHSRLLWDEALPAINMNNWKQFNHISKICSIFLNLWKKLKIWSRREICWKPIKNFWNWKKIEMICYSNCTKKKIKILIVLMKIQGD